MITSLENNSQHPTEGQFICPDGTFKVDPVQMMAAANPFMQPMSPWEHLPSIIDSSDVEFKAMCDLISKVVGSETNGEALLHIIDLRKILLEEYQAKLRLHWAKLKEPKTYIIGPNGMKEVR